MSSRFVIFAVVWWAAGLAACATPSATSGEGTGERGRATFTTGIDAVDATNLAQTTVATIVSLTWFAGCSITLGDDCSTKAENAGRRAIGRAPRDEVGGLDGDG